MLYYYFDKIESTQKFLLDHLKPLSKKLNLYKAIICHANVQTKAMGTKGKFWLSHPGTIQMSVLCKSTLPNTAIMFAEYVSNLINSYGLRTNVKPPNDITIDHKKCCGIKVDRLQEHYQIVGIGLNFEIPAKDIEVISQQIDREITSISLHHNIELSRYHFTNQLLKTLYSALNN